ncbi:MAG: hypothetical protein NWF03_01435 [Candidatus Bathyarchaeota archaeon]|nr:hypothetical protein [Candidatus Bathyarchaeota archaeon]
MSGNEDKERIKKAAQLREIVEKRIQKLQSELEEQKLILSLIDTTLVSQSFKRAEVQQPATPQTQPQVQPAPKPVTAPKPVVTPSPAAAPQRRGVPLKTVTGDVLAEIFADKDTVQIVFPTDKTFDVSLPPFRSFFVDRVLAKMQEKDREDASKGQLTPDKILAFSIKQDGDVLKQITIRNVRPERARELKSSLRWTLEKMYERMQQKNQPA